MQSAPVLPAFAPRPLRPTIAVNASIAPGQLEPTSREAVPRGGRAAISSNAIVAGGGFPLPLTRIASFATILPGQQTPVVNQVTGVPANPNNGTFRRR